MKWKSSCEFKNTQTIFYRIWGKGTCKEIGRQKRQQRMPAHGSLTKEKGFPGGPALKNLPACQYRGHGVDPWVRKTPWRREWQPTPVFLPGAFHGQSSLVGYSPWALKEWDKAE